MNYITGIQDDHRPTPNETDNTATMNMLATSAGIINAEAHGKLLSAKSLKEKVRAVFSVAKNHWMFTDNDIQFQAALAVILVNLDKDSEDYNKIELEISMLKALNAMLSGVPVDFGRVDIIDFEPIGLLKMWDET